MLVLLLALCMAVPVAADVTISSAGNWNETTLNSATGTVYVTGNWVLQPLYQNGDSWYLSGDVTLDFSGFTGTFAGITGGTGCNSAVIGRIYTANGYSLIINDAHLKDVRIDSCESSVGGLVGSVYYANVTAVGCTITNCCNISGISAVGGLVGYSYSANVTADECSVLNCDISGEESIGGLIGFVNSGNVTADGCSVSDCSISSNNSVGGLIGVVTTSARVTADECSVFDCTISGGNINSVGGLVGVTSAEGVVTVNGCNVAGCSISGGGPVGGLVGESFIASVTADGCSVSDCSISSNNAVGGLVGISEKGVVTVDGCNVAGCSISGGDRNSVGGLIGFVSSGSVTADGCSVSDCSISSNNAVGGLIGGALTSARVTTDECSVLNCTISSELYVGGLVGYVDSVSSIDGGSGGVNVLKNCSINSGVFLGKVIGGVGTVSLIGNNPIYVSLEDVTGATALVGQRNDAEFDGRIIVVSSTANKHPITVTSTTGGSASASVSTAAAGTEITLTATPDSGYTFREWQVLEGSVTITGNKFTMPTHDVKINAVFNTEYVGSERYLGNIYTWAVYSDIGGFPIADYSTWVDELGNTVTFLKEDNNGNWYINGYDIEAEGDYRCQVGGITYHIAVKMPTAPISGVVYDKDGNLISGLIGSTVLNDQYIEVNELDGGAKIAYTNQDGYLTTAPNTVQIYVNKEKNLMGADLGVWKVQAYYSRSLGSLIDGKTISQFAPESILGKPYYFTIVRHDTTIKLNSVVNEVIQGGCAPIDVIAPVGIWTVSVEDGMIPEGQLNVNNIETRDGLCYADITVSASGVASFVVQSTSTLSIKVRLYNQNSDTIANAIIINVIPGAITAEAEPNSVCIGDKLDVHGTNDFGGTLYFFIKGTNYKLSPIQKDGATLRSSGKIWEVTVDTSQIKRENGRSIDAGTYTIYAVKLADGVTVNQISDVDNIENEELVYAYAAVSVALKQQFISLTKVPDFLVQGEKFKATGIATGSPAEVMYYIFGTNYFKSGRSLVINSQFTVEMPETETKKDKLAAGQYFIIAQHPMYDGLFNIGPVADGSNSYNIVLNQLGAYNDGVNTVLFNTNNRQSANAAQALCVSLDSQDIDDMYAKATFIVGSPISLINPIPAQVNKGDILTVSGTTLGHVGDVVTVELLSTAFAAIPKEVVGAASFVALTTTIGESGIWSVSFDTSNINADEYTCSVAVGQLDATTTKVIISDNTLPISLTVDKTNLYVSEDVTSVDVCFTYTIAGEFTSAELSFGDGSQPVSLTESTGMIVHTYNLNDLYSSKSSSVDSKSGNDGSYSSSSRNYGSSVWLSSSRIFTAVLTVNSGSGSSIKSCPIVITRDSGSSGSGGFTVTKAPIISPSGSLIPGDRVTASVEIKLPQGAVDTASKLSFDTPLAGDVWTVDIIKAGTIINTKHPAPPYQYISGFDLDYDTDITVRINVEGIVPSDASGKEISVLMIRADGMHSAGLSTYSSQKQFVYNPNNLDAELAVLGNAITTLNTRIAYYQGEERDVGKASSYTEQARTKYVAAQNAAASDVATAFKNIEASKVLVKNAQMELALTALTMSQSYTTLTDDVITTLYSKGKSAEGMLVETKNTELKIRYSQLLPVYLAGNVPDAASLDKLAADSFALWNEATGYLDVGLLESLKLSPGWNFISVPKKLDAVNDVASELFANVNTEGKNILSYNAESKLWEQVVEDTKITPLNAYWIYSVDEITLAPVFNTVGSTPGQKTLKKGWNAVGLSAEEAHPASIVFNGMNWRSYISWNAAWQKYDSPLVKGQSGKYGDENLISLWKGGWVYMEEDGTYLAYT